MKKLGQKYKSTYLENAERGFCFMKFSSVEKVQYGMINEKGFNTIVNNWYLEK